MGFPGEVFCALRGPWESLGRLLWALTGPQLVSGVLGDALRGTMRHPMGEFGALGRALRGGLRAVSGGVLAAPWRARGVPWAALGRPWGSLRGALDAIFRFTKKVVCPQEDQGVIRAF